MQLLQVVNLALLGANAVLLVINGHTLGRLDYRSPMLRYTPTKDLPMPRPDAGSDTYTTVAEPSPDAERLWELERRDRAAGRERWIDRREAKRAAIEPPESKLRIRHDAILDVWICEIWDIEEGIEPSGHVHHLGKSGYLEPRPLTSEEWDRREPEVWSIWRSIGPEVNHSTEAARKAGIKWTSRGFFSTFAEAKAWLKAYCEPVDQEVYFDEKGNPAK